MEEDFKKNRREKCPQLLDLIPKKRDWRDAGGCRGVTRGGGETGVKASEDKNLELRLGLPGGEDEECSVLSLGFFSKASKNTTSNTCDGAKRGFFNTAEFQKEDLLQQQQQHAGFFLLQSRACSVKELSKKTSRASGKAEQQKKQQQQGLERKAAHAAPENATGANNSSQTRTSPAPVVGWPPIRSFRKNLASTSSKPPSIEPPNGCLENREKVQESKKGLFVKINMDGIPIGRKVDLNANDSYEKLSLAVEELFQGLLAAQKDPSTDEEQNKEEGNQVFTRLLDGTGEYTLVYEDHEGDRMLVGDVPWDMFVSTAKRLRVLKSSDLSALRLGPICRKRTATQCRVE